MQAAVHQDKMSPILGYASMLGASTQGITRGFNGAAQAGAAIAGSSLKANSGDVVSLSPEAVAQSKGSEAPEVGGIEGPMIDLRVSKYVAVANMRVLSTADQMAEDLTSILDR